MKLVVEGIEDGGVIPEKYAFGAPDPDTHVRLSDNLNPGLRWEGVPDGTRTLVLICVDSDVPTDPTDVNQEGRTVPASLLRARFYHWLVVDLPPGLKGIAEGECSRGVTVGGKHSAAGPGGSRQGRNDYTLWFEGDPDMGGVYYGYDGPCPPWNDSIPHHYHFVLYATDFERCPVEGAFAGDELEAALAGHVLARAEVTGVYSLNPAVPASSR